MPPGLRPAICFHCGREFSALGSETTTCPQCHADGHAGTALDCPACAAASAALNREARRLLREGTERASRPPDVPEG